MNLYKSSNILSILLFVFLCLPAKGMDYRVEVLDMHNGLSNNNVVNVTRDKRGVVWVATEDGLNSFDGTNFQVYRRTKNGLSENALNCVLDDPVDPCLWVGTQRSGLNRYNYVTGEFTHVPVGKNDDGTWSEGITSITTDRNQLIWISNYEGGIDCFDRKTGKFRHYNRQNVKGLDDDRFWCVLSLGNGLIVGGHVSAGISVIDTRRRKAINYKYKTNQPQSLVANEVTSLYQDRKGRIWVGTSQGLCQFDISKGSFFRWTFDTWLNHRIYSIKEMANGELWVASELSGVTIIPAKQLSRPGNPQTHIRLTTGLAPWSLPGNTVRSIAVDDFGNVWMGTYGEGLVFLTSLMPLFQQISYSPISTPYNIPTNSVLALCEDTKGRMWIGSDGAGLNLIDATGKRLTDFKLLDGKAVQASARTSNGDMIFGCFNGGAYLMKAGTTSLLPLFPQHKDMDVRYIDASNDNEIYICTSVGLFVTQLSHLGQENLYRRYVPKGTPLTRAVCKDLQGNIWLGTFNAGIDILSPQLKLLAHYQVGKGLPSNTINCIIRDQQGRIWIATAEGLMCQEYPGDKELKIYDSHNGLNNNNVRAITQDRTGNIWVSTNNGISCLKVGSDRFENYDYGDNLPAGNFNACCVAQTSTGKLWWGSNHGICFFAPQRVLNDTVTAQVRITSALLYKGDGQQDSVVVLIDKDHLKVSYSERTLRIFFALRNYALNGQVEYEYRIDGGREGWMKAESNNILFTHLTPGNYKIELRCRTQNKKCSPATSFQLSVMPPIWLSWWAKLIYLILAVLLVYLFQKNYMRHIRLKYLYESEKKSHEKEKQLNAERSEFYTNIAHELRTPITLVIGPLEELTHETGVPAQLGKRIKAIYHSAERLNELISRLLEFRKSESMSRQLSVGRSNIVASLKEIYSRYTEMYQNSPVRIEFLSSDDTVNMYFDKEVLGIILDNLMSNAMKYTEHGVVTMGLKTGISNGERVVEISVTDTGYGISPEALPHIFDRFYQERGPHQASGTGIGLALVHNMVELHKGKIDVTSKEGLGTKFIVTLLRDYTYGNPSPSTDEEKEEPIQTFEAGENQSQQAQEENENEAERQRLLIVEDNAEICQYIADCFVDKFTIYTAADGRKGVEEAFRVIPDIIISDVMMPNLSGTDLCKVLKSDIRTSHIPIILLTAKDSSAAKQEGYEAGADSYITKPFVKSLIESRIDNLLAQRRRLRISLGANSTMGLEEKKKFLLSSLGQLDKDFLDKVESLVENHISDENIDIQFLAKNLCMSSSTLYRKMKSLTGLSANEYVRKIKMKHAEKLLLEGKYTVAEVSYEVGMSSVAYFRKCFKEEFGVPPSEYIKKILPKRE